MVESEDPSPLAKKKLKDSTDKPTVELSSSVAFNQDDTQKKNGRTFIEKWWQYMKQSCPVINTYRYYFRLEPRWTRALYIFIGIQSNFLL